MSESESLLKSLSFCVLDLETTGGNLKYDKIIEIGMVKIKNLEIGEEKEFLINPEIEIPKFVQKLTSISQSKVESAPKIEDVIDEVIEFLGDDILVAHNTSFDIPFLNSILRRLKKKKLENKVICTNVMTKYLVPEMMSSSLTHLCDVFKIDHRNAHRALADAMSTAKILIMYLNIFSERKISKVNQLYYPRNKFELDKLHLNDKKVAKNKIQKLIKEKQSFFVITKDNNGVYLNFEIFHQDLEKQNIDIILNEKWETLSIQMIGNFFQALVFFKDHFFNLPSDCTERLLKEIEKNVMISENSKSKMINDFLILPHLVRGQFMIFSKKNISYKNKLIFKLPSQVRKLDQFIKSQQKPSNAKKQRLPQNESYDSLVNILMNYEGIKSEKPYIVKASEVPSKNINKITDFFNPLEEQVRNTSSFPFFHI